jgi:hypothetical protein
VAREEDDKGLRGIRVCIKELYDEAAVDAEGLDTHQCGTDEKMKDTLLLNLIVDAEVEAAICREKSDPRCHGIYERGLVLLDIDISSIILSVMESNLLVSLEEGATSVAEGLRLRAVVGRHVQRGELGVRWAARGVQVKL